MSLLIYIISFLEGFTTLSIEIIAIRNFTPIVGTNSISTSIILGVILLALSYGYYIGGKNSKNMDFDSLKNKIIINLSIASFYYLFFTFILDEFIISLLISTTGSYFWGILVSSLLLFFIPIFLASQTIPLLSEMLKGENIGEKMGKLLFFSTIGSFIGSIVTSMVLFSSIGVEKSATLNSIILSFLAIILIIIKLKDIKILNLFTIVIFIFGILTIIQKDNLSENIIFKKANSYHNIVIYNEGNKRILSQNTGYASGIDIETKKSFFKYIIEIKENTIKNKYKNVAIIGAAGFTLPNELAEYEHIKNIDVIDVDSSLKKITEEYFLEKKLSSKINFVNNSSRFFINNAIKDRKKYDVIIVDVYVGNSLAPETLTLEFFKGLKEISDIIYINMITDKKLKSDFSIRLLNTMKEAFGEIYYNDVNQYDFENIKTNFIMSNQNIPGYNIFLGNNDKKIYLDDKNSIELDLFKTK